MEVSSYLHGQTQTIITYFGAERTLQSKRPKLLMTNIFSSSATTSHQNSLPVNRYYLCDKIVIAPCGEAL